MQQKKAIYTVIINQYDALKEPEVISDGFDYICFTNNPDLKSSVWKIVPCEVVGDPVLFQRSIKILSHQALEEYDLTIYIDGSTVQVKDFNELLKSYRGGAMFKQHPRRDCVYQEITACIRLKKDSDNRLRNQWNEYMKDRVPHHLGLAETGIMVRDKSDAVIKLNEAWYNEVKGRSIRDQISLPVAARKAGIKLNLRPYAEMQQYIKVVPHNVKYVPPSPDGVRISYIQPYATDLNIGRAYNEEVARIPDDHYVVILDQDVMFLHPKTKAQIQAIVNKNTDYALFGCRLSRIGSGRQCPGGQSSDDPNIMNHYEIAKDLHEREYGQVSHYHYPIAGAFMCFPKATWNRVKFQEKNIAFDTQFSRDVMRFGKIGMMEGVYLFHLYRLWAENPKAYKDHLRNVTI